MNLTKRFVSLASSMVLVLAAVTAVARAQETPAPSMETPAPAASPTLMDRQYDGQMHVTVAPYVWLPTVHGNIQYTIPNLPFRAGHTAQVSFSTGPSDYISKLNSAAMGAFDVRKGDVDIFGDYIYTNATASASTSGTLSGPRGRVQIPISLSTSARLAASIWEAAAGFTIARGHDADLSMFLGVREFPINLTLGYDAVIGKRGVLTPSGTIAASTLTNDVIWGVRGKAFLDDSHIFVPYYFDVGSGNGNQTWEGYTGGGYAFNHGQTLLFTWRSLNYYSFPPVSRVQKLTMSGPLLGYTFNL